jgi:mannose-6-phosphate isomerase-like protein (cupin superfamily)
MKLQLLVLALLMTAALLTGGDTAPSVRYFGHETVSAALAHGGGLMSAPDFLLSCNHRSGPGHVEFHQKETDIFYVVDGDAIFVTGGKMVGAHATSPGQLMGTDIIGGEVHHLTKGDVIVIRAGTPHWFKEVPHSFSYFVVKVLKP